MKNFEELAGGLQRSLARGIGSIAASYQCYLARANALAVAQARTAERSSSSQTGWQLLLIFCGTPLVLPMS